MEIQTYEIEEHTTEGRDPFEVEAEAQALIDELGLEGQQKLYGPDEDGVATRTRIPYRRMTQEEARVYGVLYPEQTKVSTYRAGPIPLRVLQVIAHGRTMFDRLEVWGPTTEDPDPILVGYLKGDNVREDRYLLARWGDALEPFEVLYERAQARLTRDWKAKAEQVIAECQAFIATPGGAVGKYLAGEWVHKPWTA